MHRRQIGPDGPMISQVSYGTMRMRTEVDGRSPTELLCHLHDLGIDTHHSSSEYDAHPLYLEALKKGRSTGRQFQHIVKVSEPSWESSVFSAEALRKKVDEELHSLGAETLSSVQWLVRTPDPTDDKTRLAIAVDQAGKIAATIRELIASGKVGDVSTFPYSTGFASVAASSGITKTLCTYLNPLELEYLPVLSEFDAVLAIRPLAAGQISAADEREEALRFPLLHPEVATIIVSANSDQNIKDVVKTAGHMRPNSAEFDLLSAAYLRGNDE